MCTTFPVQFAIYLHLSVFQKAQIVFALTAHAVWYLLKNTQANKFQIELKVVWWCIQICTLNSES